jgi:hypothetical protein
MRKLSGRNQSIWIGSRINNWEGYEQEKERPERGREKERREYNKVSVERNQKERKRSCLVFPWPSSIMVSFGADLLRELQARVLDRFPVILMTAWRGAFFHFQSNNGWMQLDAQEEEEGKHDKGKRDQRWYSTYLSNKGELQVP